MKRIILVPLLFIIASSYSKEAPSDAFYATFPDRYFRAIEVTDCDLDPVLNITRPDASKISFVLDASLSCEYVKRVTALAGSTDLTTGEVLNAKMGFSKTDLTLVSITLFQGSSFSEESNELIYLGTNL